MGLTKTTYGSFPFEAHPEYTDLITSTNPITSIFTNSFIPGPSPAIACSLICLQYVACIAFYLKMPEGKCNLYNAFINDTSKLIPEEGWKYYTIPVRLPRSCLEVWSCGLQNDGDYWIQPNAVSSNETARVKLYCDHTGKDYISLDPESNYFEQKRSGIGCFGAINRWIQFIKISINLTTLQVDKDDITFTYSWTGYPLGSYGMIKDGTGNANLTCVRPRASINLSETGFKISEKTTWTKTGTEADILKFTRNLENTQVTYECGGIPGRCYIQGPLYLDVIGQQDSMETDNVVYCRG